MCDVPNYAVYKALIWYKSTYFWASPLFFFREIMSVLLNVFFSVVKEFFADSNKRFTQEKTIQSLTICMKEINQVKVNTIQMGIPRE